MIIRIISYFLLNYGAIKHTIKKICLYLRGSVKIGASNLAEISVALMTRQGSLFLALCCRSFKYRTWESDRPY